MITGFAIGLIVGVIATLIVCLGEHNTMWIAWYQAGFDHGVAAERRDLEVADEADQT